MMFDTRLPHGTWLPPGPFRHRYVRLLCAASLAMVTLMSTVCYLVLRDPHRGRSPGTPAPISAVASRCGFEDGTACGWVTSGGARLGTSTAAAHGGRRSLAVSRPTAVHGDKGWYGAQVDLASAPGGDARYMVVAWIRLARADRTGTVRVTVSVGTAGPPVEVATSQVSATSWTLVTANYTTPQPGLTLSVSVQAAATVGSFFLDDVAIDDGLAVLPSLKDIFTDDFLVGTAVGLPQLVGDQAALLRAQFNSVTPTNALKWASTQPREGSFDFAASDAIINFAWSNGIKVRGHTLVWYNQTPDWVFQDASGAPMTPTPANKALLLSRMEHHISTLVSRYRGKVYAWDVVNEALSDDGSLRDSRWYRIAGLDYIRDAFITAHAADPGAQLCINDYGLTVAAKRDAMYQLVRRLRREHVPVDCIGHQMHGNIRSPSVRSVAKSIDTLATLGVDQQITEMDLSVYTDDISSYPVVPASALTAQARRYRDLFQVFRARRSALSSVTVWGISDADTWLNAKPFPRMDAPLLFDRQLRPKAAFWALTSGNTPTS